MSNSKMSSFQMKMMKTANKVQNNYVISSITQGMMSTMGVLMAGAIINIIVNLPIPAWTNVLSSIKLLEPLQAIVTLLNCVSIFMTFGIARVAAEKRGVGNPVEAGILGLMCLLIVTPITNVEGANYLSMDILGAQGVITAMIVGVLAGYLYSRLSKTKLKIKMPDSVPPFVSQSFENLPSLFVTVVPFIIVRVIFGMTAAGSFTAFVNQMIQGPLTLVGNTLGGHLILLVACSLLWWLGMHGTLIIYPALMIVLYAPLVENITAISMGQAAPNLLSMMTMFSIIQLIGGPGCLFGLFVDMAFFTKSERYKAQGKLQLVPGLFNIIEPAIYGLPIVLNFTLLLPLVLLPVLIYVLMYMALKMGLFTTPIIMASSFIPGPIAGFLAGGGLGFGVFIILACVLSCVIYYPFVKIMDAQQLKVEQGE